MNESQRHVEVAKVIKASLDSNEDKYKAMVNERDELKSKLTAAEQRMKELEESERLLKVRLNSVSADYAMATEALANANSLIGSQADENDKIIRELKAEIRDLAEQLLT